MTVLVILVEGCDLQIGSHQLLTQHMITLVRVTCLPLGQRPTAVCSFKVIFQLFLADYRLLAPECPFLGASCSILLYTVQKPSKFTGMPIGLKMADSSSFVSLLWVISLPRTWLNIATAYSMFQTPVQVRMAVTPTSSYVYNVGPTTK